MAKKKLVKRGTSQQKESKSIKVKDVDGNDHVLRATVIGIDHEYNLRGTTMSSPDIRAGVSLLIAALSADGFPRSKAIISLFGKS